MSKRLAALVYVFGLLVSLVTMVRTADAAADRPPAAGNPMFAPLKWAGLWTTDRSNGSVLACTAQFITPRVILLAAHCITDRTTGEFLDPDNRNSRFALQYQNDSYSKIYRPVCKATYVNWVVPLKQGERPLDPDWSKTMTPERHKEYLAAFEKSWQWDYAFVLLDADSITGHYNYHINEQWNGGVATGYPGELMGGSVVQIVNGDIFSTDVLKYSMPDDDNLQALWHGNEQFSQGSSGGAWVVNPSADKEGPDTNIIVGLNSFTFNLRPGASFGPRLTGDFPNLLKFVEGGCKADAK